MAGLICCDTCWGKTQELSKAVASVVAHDKVGSNVDTIERTDACLLHIGDQVAFLFGEHGDNVDFYQIVVRKLDRLNP